MTEHQLMLGFLTDAGHFCIVALRLVVERELRHACALRLVGQCALQKQDTFQRGSDSSGPQLCTSAIGPLLKFVGSDDKECRCHKVAKHNQRFRSIRKAVECVDVERRRDADDGTACSGARRGRFIVAAFDTRGGSRRGEIPDWTFRALRLLSKVG